MDRTVSAILLAAGASSRFAKGNKLLADLGGRPLICWTAEGLVAGGVAEIIVVTGPKREQIEEALRASWLISGATPFIFVYNPDHAAGMGSSIASGIARVSPTSMGALVCPGDMPGVTGALVRQLIGAFQDSGSDRIVCPRTPEGRQGNPVLWPRRTFDRLARLNGGQGGKALLSELAHEVITVSAEGFAASVDIDTVEDLEQYKSQVLGLGAGSD